MDAQNAVSDDHSTYLIRWLEDHPYLKIHGLCKKAGVDTSNFTKCQKAGHIPLKYVKKLLPELQHYGYPVNPENPFGDLTVDEKLQMLIREGKFKREDLQAHIERIETWLHIQETPNSRKTGALPVPYPMKQDPSFKEVWDASKVQPEFTKALHEGVDMALRNDEPVSYQITDTQTGETKIADSIEGLDEATRYDVKVLHEHKHPLDMVSTVVEYEPLTEEEKQDIEKQINKLRNEGYPADCKGWGRKLFDKERNNKIINLKHILTHGKRKDG